MMKTEPRLEPGVGLPLGPLKKGGFLFIGRLTHGVPFGVSALDPVTLLPAIAFDASSRGVRPGLTRVDPLSALRCN